METNFRGCEIEGKVNGKTEVDRNVEQMDTKVFPHSCQSLFINQNNLMLIILVNIWLNMVFQREIFHF